MGILLMIKHYSSQFSDIYLTQGPGPRGRSWTVTLWLH